MNDFAELNMSLSDKVFSHLGYFKNYIHFLNMYRRRYKNFIPVIIKVLKNQYPVKVIFRGGGSGKFNDYQEIYNNLMELDVDKDIDVVYLNGLKFHGGKSNGDIVSIFKRNEYSFLPVNGKEVLDIGANIGDSSIYFAMMGARNVVAIEPDSISYEYANKNMVANGYSKIVKTILAGCASKDTINSENKIQFLSLATLLKEYCTCPEILKVDCEGCEYDFILNASCNDLRKFTHIQIEYHSGYQNLKSKLEECGFDVTYTKPSFFIPFNKNRTTRLIQDGNVSQSNRMFIGWLYATNKKF